MFTVFMQVLRYYNEELFQMKIDDYTKERLWQLLVEAVHASVMYPTHKAYTRDTILLSKPDISPQELSERLGMPFGEALIILNELEESKKETLMEEN